MKPILKNNKGFLLLFSFAIIVTLSLLVAVFLFLSAVITRDAGFQEIDRKNSYLAESGINKAVWYLENTAPDGSTNGSWRTPGLTENLGGGSYTMIVENFNLALSSSGATATATSSRGANTPNRAIDNNMSTWWESNINPTTGNPQILTITFPSNSNYFINKARFRLNADQSNNTPRDYTWQVSTNGSTWTTVFTQNNNTSVDVTNTFSLRSDVNFIRLRITDTKSNFRAIVAELETSCIKITSTGQTGALTKTVEQKVLVDTDQAYKENRSFLQQN